MKYVFLIFFVLISSCEKERCYDIEGKEIIKSFLLPETAIYEESYVYILENGKPIKAEVKIRGNIKNKMANDIHS